jgi:hypothetical protein
MSKTHPDVLNLLEHLKDSGTGQSKLDALRAIGDKCGADKEKFLVLAAKEMPQGTMEKISAYVAAKTGDKPPAKEFVEGFQAGVKAVANELPKDPVNNPNTAAVKTDTEAAKPPVHAVKDAATGKDIADKESPVKNMAAQEAIPHIANMRSEDKLQDIADCDTRPTVKEAAKKRLAELEAKAENK